jgi:hypothetical protein
MNRNLKVITEMYADAAAAHNAFKPYKPALYIKTFATKPNNRKQFQGPQSFLISINYCGNVTVSAP